MKKLITIATIVAVLITPNFTNTAFSKQNSENLVQKVLTNKEYDEEESFYLTEEQIKEKYEDFYMDYHRRKDRVIKKGDKYITNYADKEIEVPQKFIDTLLSHLEQAKKVGYCEYIFYADLGHCHAGLPKEHFEKEYEGLTITEIREKSLSDPKLMHLYHSREHLVLENPKNRNRNFLGYFDGRKIRLIHSKMEKKSHTVFDDDREDMREYDNYLSVLGLLVYFSAHKDGLFQLKDGTRFDIAI